MGPAGQPRTLSRPYRRDVGGRALGGCWPRAFLCSSSGRQLNVCPGQRPSARPRHNTEGAAHSCRARIRVPVHGHFFRDHSQPFAGFLGRHAWGQCSVRGLHRGGYGGRVADHKAIRRCNQRLDRQAEAAHPRRLRARRPSRSDPRSEPPSPRRRRMRAGTKAL